MRITQCPRCGAEVLVARQASGLQLQLDARPRRGVVQVLGLAQLMDVWVPHAETCQASPKAQEVAR